LLVVAEKRTPLRYQFPSLPLIITHFLSNSSFPTSIAATSSAATMMTTTYDQEVVVFLAVEKDKNHHNSKINSYRHLLQNPKTIHRHTERRKTATTKKRNTGPSSSSQEWARQEKPSQRTTLHKTTKAKVITTGIKQAIKQSKRIDPVSFFSSFFPS
jgi:hypothetical protein